MPADTRALTRTARERVRFTGERHTDALTALQAQRDQADVPAPERAVVRVVRAGERGDGYALTLTPAAGTTGGFEGWGRTLPVPHVPLHTVDLSTDDSLDHSLDHVVADRVLAEACWVRTVEWDGPLLAAGREVTVRRTESAVQARAVREATYTPPEADRPCRCSTRALTGAPCLHGTACEGDGPDDPCAGRLVHLDRYPGSHWGPTTWEDRYACRDCGLETYRYGDLDGLPWGRQYKEGEIVATAAFEGTRHPGFGDDDDGPVDGCGECGASSTYNCHCPRACSECGANADDAYGCDCYDPSEDG